MKRKILLVLMLLPCFLARAQRTSISLEGTWHLALDKADSGIKACWFKRQFKQKIKLPGTLDDAGIGEPVKTDTSVLSKEIMLHLSRRVKFTGPVWYQKSFTLTTGMSNARLMLERVIWKTDCWIDGRPAGSRESLIAPQNFDLGQLKPGIHVVTLRIDNRKQHDISFNDFAHAYTDGTQIIWNGIIGRIAISDRAPVSFDRIVINSFPDNKRAVANIELSARSQERVYLRHRLSIDGKTIKVSSKKLLQTNLPEETAVILPEIKRWDEFHPNIYTWTFELIDKKGKILDTRSEHFGFRQLVSQHNQLRINGRPLFLRGTLECNIFPDSGHPPMERAGWLKVFNAAKSYGLNHLRFHSWCPPEAAFRVADSLGFYLHVELPLWSLDVGKDAETLRYLELEAQEIINNYGNHPSFCFWSMGNELEGNFAWLENLVKKLKNEDNRHLYTTTTFSFQKGHGKSPEPQDDFFITQYTEKGWVRGQGIFNTNAPDFKTDYSKSLADVSVPLVIHEVGQYSVFPDLSEIARYTGVLAPANFQAVRNDMRKKGMLDLAAPYLKASGRLSANLYKEEIERALKTKGVGGFQLLDLHDFPGQGTALVGILNAFWESKGIMSPEAFREFCGAVVPLLRFQKATYTNNENFRATAEVANYLDKNLNDELLWTIADKRHRVLVKGSLGIKQYAVGNGESAGEINIPLSACKEASELTVKLSLKNAGYTNQWKIWVYPQEPELKENNVIFTTSVDTALNLLKDGKTVLLNPDTSAIKGIDGRFAPVFWSPVHFPDQPGSMGLLINQSHQSLADFPTDDYSDWQWWDLVTRSRSIPLEGLSTQPAAIVRVIDNFFRNRNLGVLMEYKSGNGKLLLCTMDIQHDLINRPAARQLKVSLLNYAGSKDFNPSLVLNTEKLYSISK